VVTGALGLAAFVRIEGRVRDPLLPLELLRDRSFSSTLAANAFNSGAYMGAFVIAPLLLYDAFGFSITQASLLMAVRTVSLTLASPVGGALGERFGERRASILGCTLMTIALAGIAWAAWESSLVAFAVGLVGQGVGHGLCQPSITSAIARSVDETELGIASAANRLAGQGGAAFGVAALTLVYGGRPEPAVFAQAFALGAVLAGVSTLCSLWIDGGPVPVSSISRVQAGAVSGRSSAAGES
jgi:MFS family permease